MIETLQQLQAWFTEVAPDPYIQAGVIILVFILAASLVDKIICGGMARWARRTETTLDDTIIAMMHRPIRNTVVIMGLELATVRLPLPATPEFVTLALLNTILIWVWLRVALKTSRLVLGFLSRHQDRFEMVQTRTLPVFLNVAMLVIVAAAIYTVLVAWDINITAWVASAGIIGLALSFAAKHTLANLFAGMSILADVPYRVGDYVILETGERGEVTSIGMRSTRILTRDDVEVSVPNGIMGNTKIVNETGGPSSKYRLRVKVGVAYGSDIDKVREVLLGVAHNNADVSPKLRCTVESVRSRCQRDTGSLVAKCSSMAVARPRLPSAFSKSIGFTLCGIVDEPTSFFAICWLK